MPSDPASPRSTDCSGMIQTGLSVLLALLTSTALAERPEQGASMLKQFVGVCQAQADPKRPELWDHIGFVRHDLSWSKTQPKGPHDWNEAYLEEWGRMVLKNREYGVEVLPTLDYMAPWAARRRAWSFTIGQSRYDVAAANDDKARTATVTDLKTGKTTSVKLDPGRLPPEDVADWERFVDRVVGFLAKPPYAVKYFQPWNEAHDQFTGFWCGGMDEYMKTVHLPAARIIRKHGGKVVFGGYPCCGSMRRLIDVCEKHNAWDTLDVVDIHYFPLSAWQYLYDRVVATGKVEGLWQTEVGFTKDTSWVPNAYPRFFCWALRRGPWQPRRFMIYQFAYWSPDDPKAYGYLCCFLRSETLSHHGKAFAVLGRLLGGGVVEPFADWRTDPVLRTELNENASSVEGFSLGKGRRIVLAVHLMKNNAAAIFTDWNLTGDSLHVDWPYTTMRVFLPTTPAVRIKAASRVGIYGSRLPLRIEPAGKGACLIVPVCDGDRAERTDNRAAKAATFYVDVELAAAEAPHDARPRALHEQRVPVRPRLTSPVNAGPLRLGAFRRR